jgi:hypothetical protein
VPTPHLAISDIRVWRIGEGKKPNPVTGFHVQRREDLPRRDDHLEMHKKNVQGYNVREGIARISFTDSWLIYDDNQLLLKGIDYKIRNIIITIEAFNENGIFDSFKANPT